MVDRILLQAIVLMFAAVSSGYSLADDSPAVDAVPDVELEVWRPRWEESVTKVQAMMASILNKEEFSDVDAAAKSAALAEINAALDKGLSWEEVGEFYVSENLLQLCGADLLVEIAPYHSDPEKAAAIPDELANRYTSCWIDMDLQVSSGPAVLSMGFFKDQVGPILERHGISPDGGALR